MERSFAPFSGRPSSGLLRRVVQYHGLDAGGDSQAQGIPFATGSLAPVGVVLTSLLAPPLALPAMVCSPFL